MLIYRQSENWQAKHLVHSIRLQMIFQIVDYFLYLDCNSDAAVRNGSSFVAFQRSMTIHFLHAHLHTYIHTYTHTHKNACLPHRALPMNDDPPLN